jgi:microcystin-dependent protein
MEAYISMITPYGLNFTIQGWAECRGQLLSVAQQTALYSLLGTNYGGNGFNTFGLPNLQSRSPISYGQSPGTSFYPQGAAGGIEYANLTLLDMPAHDHGIDANGEIAASQGMLTVSNDAASLPDPDGNYLGQGGGPVNPYTSSLSSPPGSQAAVEIPARSTQFNGSTQNAGENISFEVRNPYQGVNFQICMVGIYPSRN